MLYRGKLDVDDLIHKLLRHDQSTLAVQQLHFTPFTTDGSLIKAGRWNSMQFRHMLNLSNPSFTKYRNNCRTTTVGCNRQHWMKLDRVVV